MKIKFKKGQEVKTRHGIRWIWYNDGSGYSQYVCANIPYVPQFWKQLTCGSYHEWRNYFSKHCRETGQKVEYFWESEYGLKEALTKGWYDA